jgi:hypothetical protein
LVFQDDDRPVVESGLIVRERVNGTVKGSADGSSGRGEKIEAQVDSSALGGGVLAGRELVGGIKRARLVVTADRNRNIRGVQDCLDFLCCDRFGEFRGVGAEIRAPDTEIEYNAVSLPGIRGYQRRRGVGILRKPLQSSLGLGDSGETTGGAKGIVGKTRMDFGEALKSSPCGGFRDGNVRVVRDQRSPMSGIDHADCEAGANQREEGGDLMLVERKSFVIGA